MYLSHSGAHPAIAYTNKEGSSPPVMRLDHCVETIVSDDHTEIGTITLAFTRGG